jgi:hypothetical protein
MICEDCRGQLVDPFSDEAQGFSEDVWRYIRLQYGARRGMLVRVMAIFSGVVVAAVGLRGSLIRPVPWSVICALLSLAAGVATWALLHWLAGQAVRLFVLRRGRLRRTKLARALWKRATR